MVVFFIFIVSTHRIPGKKKNEKGDASEDLKKNVGG